MVDIYFGIYTLLAIFFSLYGMVKYKTVLNVLSVSVVMFSISVVIAFPFYSLVNTNTPNDSIILAIIISIFYLISFSFAFFIRISFLTSIYDKFMTYFTLDSSRRVLRYKNKIFFGFLILFLFSYVVLMLQSGGKFLWIENPRLAYMNYRQGSGHLYAIARWMLITAFIFYLWFRKPKYKSIIVLFLFSFMAYFLGSKGFILYFWIVFLFYWNYLVAQIKNSTLILSGIFLFILFLSIQLVQGTAQNITDTIKYFTYFDATAKFLSMFDQVGYQYGSAFIGQFWSMIPRDLFPDKPIVYGQYIIHETLNPGLLERGRATGILVWTRYYLDFGIPGVVIVSFLNGLIVKVLYQYFLKNATNPFAFIIMLQYGVISIYNYATGIIFIILMLLLSKWLRMWGSYSKRWYVLDKINE